MSLLDHYYQVNIKSSTTGSYLIFIFPKIVFFLVTYVVPMVGLSITYCHLGSVLWTDNQPHQTLVNRRRVKDKRKLAKMFIVILIVFGVCWLPYHTYFIYTYYHMVSKFTCCRTSLSSYSRYCHD